MTDMTINKEVSEAKYVTRDEPECRASKLCVFLKPHFAVPRSLPQQGQALHVFPDSLWCS